VQRYEFISVNVTKHNGNVTDTYSYDTWGNVNHNGATSQPYQFVGQLGYYTRYQEPNLGLMQLGVRFYDSMVGKFTQRDPIGYGSGCNVYAYASDTPVLGVDPLGLFCWHIGGDCFGTTCHGDPSCPPKNPKPKPKDPSEEALMKLGKWFVKQVAKQCCRKRPGVKLGIDIVDQFVGLPDKFRTALETCRNAAIQIAQVLAMVCMAVGKELTVKLRAVACEILVIAYKVRFEQPASRRRRSLAANTLPHASMAKHVVTINARNWR